MVTYAEYLTGESARHRHFHDSHQLLFITAGEADIKINGRTVRAGYGSLIIFSRFERHSVKAASTDFCRYVVRISPQSSIGGQLYPLFSNRPEGFSNIIDVSESFDEFCFLFKALSDEMRQEKPMKGELCELITRQLSIMIIRKIPQGYENDETFKTITAIQKTLERDFKKNFCLTELAASNNMSVSHLSHSFKKITGTSVMGYLLRCRLTEAKKLLTHSGLSIGGIVEQCGFSDASNFSRSFRAFTGLSPSGFRKKYSVVDKTEL